jgi:hypothetical protein
MTQESKRCNGPCGLVKSASEFGTRKLAAGRGLVHECKKCQKARRESNKVAAAVARLEQLQFLGLIPPPYEPFDRLNESGDSCQRLVAADSYSTDEGLECGNVPAIPVELTAPGCESRSRLRLCEFCQQESERVWPLERL